MFQYMDNNYCVVEDTIVSWKGADIKLHIPSSFEGHPIKRIGDSAFQQCDQLVEVSFAEGIEEIGQFAFEGDWRIERLIFPSTLKSIEQSAFANCERLKSVTIPEKLEKIEQNAFDSCNQLKEAHLPSKIAEFGTKSPQVFPNGNICNIYVHFRVTTDEYKAIVPKKIAINGDRLLLTDDIDEVPWLSTLKGFSLANHIDSKMNTIFLVDTPEVDISPDLRRTLFSWEGIQDMSKEDAVIRKIISEGGYRYSNADDEKQWVSDSIKGKNKLVNSFSNRNFELSFCVLEHAEFTHNNSYIEGVIRLYRAYGFFISVHRIAYKGKDYFIYSRNYLAGNKMPRTDRVSSSVPVYHRKDMAIYDINGLLSDKKLSEEIYAKYKLFSIL